MTFSVNKLRCSDELKKFEDILKGNDLRSVGQVDRVVNAIRSQADFDELYRLLRHTDRVIVMRAADAIEKCTRKVPSYLVSHSADLIQSSVTANNKEHKWHLAQILTRLPLSDTDASAVWNLLYAWAGDKSESRIVRVNALEGLAFLALKNEVWRKQFQSLTEAIERENVPSLLAKIRQLKKRHGISTGLFK